MPTVPLYDGQKVRTEALPGVRQNAPSVEAFMGPARNLGLLAKAVDAGTEILEARSVAEATHSYTAADAEIKDLMLRQRQRQGINAKGAADEFSTELDKVVQKYGADLDPFSRRAFDNLVAKQRNGLIAAVKDHEATETRRAARDGTTSLISAAIDGSAGNYTRPDLIAANLAQVNKSVDALASIEGWDADTTAVKRREYTTLHHKRVVEAAIDAAPAYARAYYDQHKDQIAGIERDGIERALRVAGTREAAQGFADGLMAKNVTEEQALAAARERFSGEQEVLAVAEVKMRFNERATAQKEAENALVNQAWAYRLQNKPIPNTLLAKLPAQRQADLLADMDRATETDWGTYGRLVAMPLDQLAQVNLADHFGQLAPAERKELLKRQASYKNGTDDEKLDAVTFQQQLASVHKDLALDKDQIGRFNKAAADAVFQAQTTKGRKLDQAERQQVIDRLLIEGTVARPWWLDTTKRAYEVQGTPEAAAFTPKVPDEDRAKIEAALQRAGVPVTEAAVMQLYRRAKGL